MISAKDIKVSDAKLNWCGQLRCDGMGYPFPNILREGTLWTNGFDGVCPTCLGEELSEQTICLRCDRWGLDS